MENALNELVRVSNIAGKDPRLVLGGFGNTSVKTIDGKYMYIKASGTALKDMSRTKGWRRLKLQAVRDILNDRHIAKASPQKRQNLMAKALICACDDKCRVAPGPSVESCFHSLLGRYVIHLHPAAVLAYACARNGQQEMNRLFKGEKFAPLWVAYTNPGYELAKRIKRLLSSYETRHGRWPRVIFLQNHGLVVSGCSSAAALGLVRRVVNKCRVGLKYPKVRKAKPPDDKLVAETVSLIRRILFARIRKRLNVLHCYDEAIASIMSGKGASEFLSGAAITPDELVYAGGPALFLESFNRQSLVRKLASRIERDPRPGAAILIKPVGLFVAAEKRRLGFIKDVVVNYLYVRAFTAGFGGSCPLNKKQRDFILGVYG